MLRGDAKVEGCDIPIFRLLQWKYAMKMEKVGLRHSSGRSVRKHACLHLGLRPRTPHDEVIAHIDAILGGKANATD